MNRKADMQTSLRIGDLARSTGTTVETIRYYERIGLLAKPDRTEGNYRAYGTLDLKRLNFIRHARGLGFEVAEIRSLLDLADHPDRDCGEADSIASGHLQAVEAKIEQLQLLQTELTRLVGACRGGRAADCRVLEVLGDHSLCEADHKSA
ncbi:MAG: helix-turn-helix domain-containing protein [Beijerinckiaceae bacterium]|jgi:Cu(I)-responsive transcriptional regulator|nr:helix-turn-helix domain-containing protein [Beijerinckiaceae bacterium]